MPHLTVEYAGNLGNFSAEHALETLNTAVIASGLFHEADIKSRAIRHETFRVGNGQGARAFIHVELAIFRGRSLEIKQALSEALLSQLRKTCVGPADTHVQLSVEVREIERECYTKSSFNG